MSLKNWLKKLKLNESTISMVLGALVVVVVGVLIFNYFSQEGKEELVPEELTPEEITIETGEPETKVLPTKHTVVGGEYLWQIAINYYQDGYQWPKIAQANNLKNPNVIVPGQELTIPKLEMTSSSVGEPITSENYTVKKGDCLWFIALRAYGDPYRWPEIARANDLVNPSLIYPENTFVIPR